MPEAPPTVSEPTVGEPTVSQGWRQRVVTGLAVGLGLFTLAEVNYPRLAPLSQLALFALFALVICYLTLPMAQRFRGAAWSRGLDLILAGLSALVCGWVVMQTEPRFKNLWLDGLALGDRAGAENSLDILVGAVGLVLVLEAARRAVGMAIPLLALLFLAYGFWGQHVPEWLFPHRGYGVERLVSQTFLHSQGVFGIALRVMFTYVFLFVVFGALLEVTGATRFIIDLARRLLGNSAGGPAKVSVLSSGLMGSLSGSAVANTATTGTFTIPLMRSAGFAPHQAAGIEAAASSGGALVPPVMGAGAYMMLEIIQPPVAYLEIVRAALLPAILYYLSLFLVVHFAAKKLAAKKLASPTSAVATGSSPTEPTLVGEPAGKVEGLIFFASLGSLLLFLMLGYTVFRSVSLAMVITVLTSQLSSRTRVDWRRGVHALVKAARGGVTLVVAAASVGVILGVVTLTGVGSKLPATLIPLAQDNLFLALLLLMVSSIVLGMGLPSAVCYLLLATLVGPALAGLGVVPLAAHLFIFYFGLMSMVTPPVALAAYTAASIAGSGIMRTAVTAFRYSLVGFILPFVFVYRPQLLMLAPDGNTADWLSIVFAFGLAALAMVPVAAASTGFLNRPLRLPHRILLALAAVGLLYPGGQMIFAGVPWLEGLPINVVNVGAAVLLVGVLLERHWRGGTEVTA